MQIWMGLFASGTQQSKGQVSDQAFSSKLAKISPTPYQLKIVREDAKNKCVSSSDGGVNYSLHKASLPYRNNQYEWELTDRQGDRTDSIVLKHGSADHVAKIERLDGTAVVTLQQGGFYTLNRFKWGSKTYRWTRSGCSDSRLHVQIKLLEDGSKQALACIEGPGSKCKSYWIQNPELTQDTMTIYGRTDYPVWMQVVIASGMVAAKTLRRMDKSLLQSAGY